MVTGGRRADRGVWDHAGVPRLAASLLSVALAGVVVLAAVTPELWLVAAAVLLVQVLVATAPAHGVPRVSRPTVFVPVVAGSLVATAVAQDPTLLRGASGTRSTEDALLSTGALAGMLLGAAVVVSWALVAQMLRRDGRDELVLSVAATATVGVLATFTAGWVAAASATASADVVTMGAVGLSAGLLVWSVPGDRVALGSAAVVAGVLAGALAAGLVDGAGTWVLGVAVGGGAAGCAVLGQVLGRAWTAGARPGPQAWAFPAAVSVAVVGPVVHLGAQLSVLVA